jgi:hypothetical protein
MERLPPDVQDWIGQWFAERGGAADGGITGGSVRQRVIATGGRTVGRAACPA